VRVANSLRDSSTTINTRKKREYEDGRLRHRKNVSYFPEKVIPKEGKARPVGEDHHLEAWMHVDVVRTRHSLRRGMERGMRSLIQLAIGEYFLHASGD